MRLFGNIYSSLFDLLSYFPNSYCYQQPWHIILLPFLPFPFTFSSSHFNPPTFPGSPHPYPHLSQEYPLYPFHISCPSHCLHFNHLSHNTLPQTLPTPQDSNIPPFFHPTIPPSHHPAISLSRHPATPPPRHPANPPSRYPAITPSRHHAIPPSFPWCLDVFT